MAKAEHLISYRTTERITKEVDAMLFELQGRRKRYRYNNAAAQQLEHLVKGPLDPMTQLPLWIKLLRLTKELPTDRQTFMGLAMSILRQVSTFSVKN
ncbi:hypothetical protein [uncultured Roseobacter sp.]|uniref:hypothetical protein n=1 Tax=uncultured Roseobacter sp. TaxID=114847 RepID=UPI0026323D77|nr:hypothetical protein [uncultured Roseobacter sp.]